MNNEWKIKDFIVPTICLVITAITISYLNPISEYLANFVVFEKTVKLPTKTFDMKSDNSYTFVQATPSFKPYGKEDIKNIYFTIINNGWNDIKFYCPDAYTNCKQDVKELSQDQTTMTHLNSYINPLNGFTNITTAISENGEVSLHVDYLYKDKEKEEIKTRIQNIIEYNNLTTLSDRERILFFHDYLVNNTKYDVARNDTGNSIHANSYTAYGALFEGFATCNGYTDAMAIFLNEIGIKNYKVATTIEDNGKSVGHIWNVVYLDNGWYHIDVTWDDPVSNDNKDYLLHTYFLLTTKELILKDNLEGDTEHNFNLYYYPELK